MICEMSGRRRFVLKEFLIASLALAVVLAGSGVALFGGVGNARRSCAPHKANRPDRILFDAGWAAIDLSRYAMPDYETVRFPSREPGIAIAGWWVPGAPDAPSVILVHGFGGCKNAADVLVPAGMLWRNGLSVLMIDLRDFGDSDIENGWTSAGNDEYLDVLGAWDWLIAEKGFTPEKVGVYGGSMGGLAALYAFSHEPRIAALFLQSTFGDLVATFADILSSYGMPGSLASPIVAIGHLVTGEDVLEHTPADAIRQAGTRPVYIVHSRGDRRISFRQSEELADAAQAAGVNVTAWFPENGDHLQTPAAYPEEFERRMVGFFRENLGE
jgi:dipeptidyl aminopeptidase/acylaminoacyl peptidase